MYWDLGFRYRYGGARSEAAVVIRLAKRELGFFFLFRKNDRVRVFVVGGPNPFIGRSRVSRRCLSHLGLTP